MQQTFSKLRFDFQLDHVALLQADGRYDLELGLNSGDYSDFFRYDFFGGIDFLFPSNYDPLLGPWPNTDSYGQGVVEKTNHYISGISGKQLVQVFKPLSANLKYCNHAFVL
jgi:hypothetical protein